MKKESFAWLKAIGVGVVIAVFLKTFFISNYVVEGESMLPTLEDGNKLIINKMEYQISDFERFDVIVFHANEKEDYVKRVIGLPGEKIEYRDDQLFINDKKVAEPYLKPWKEQFAGRKFTEDFTLYEKTGFEKVPEGMLFVLGDNRLKSEDSRRFGFISVDQVVGKVNLRYWPITELDISF